jgi:hypothetical protein
MEIGKMEILNKLKNILIKSNSSSGNRTLYLHIGMGKTGSKWLQKHWGLNREFLQSNGIFYPLAEHENPMDIKSLTAGTGLDFLKDLNLQNKLVQESLNMKCNSLLVSSEFVFNFFMFDSDGFFKAVEDLEKCGFKKIKILLFIRNIEELILSSYKQLVKVGYKAEALSFNIQNHDELIQSINFFYIKISELMEWSSSRNDLIELEIKNYSVHKNELKQISNLWLNLELNDSIIKDDLIVNRSLTAGELFLIEQLNHFNQGYLDIGIELTSNVSRVFKDKDGLDPILKMKIWDETKDARNKLNSNLSEIERFNLIDDEVAESETFTFTREQLTEISRLIIINSQKP